MTAEQLKTEYDGATGWEWTQVAARLAGTGEMVLAAVALDMAVEAYEAECQE